MLAFYGIYKNYYIILYYLLIAVLY